MDNQENNIEDAQPVPTKYRGRGRPRKCDGKDFLRKVYVKKIKIERPKVTRCDRCECVINSRDFARHIKTARCARVKEFLRRTEY